MKTRRQTKKIIIHASQTTVNHDIGVDEIKKWHTDKGWSDIGYHFVVRLNGEIERGRNIMLEGAHCKGHNHDSIGICYVGGALNKDETGDTRTEEQKKSLLNLIDFLQKTYGNLDTYGHKNFTDLKDCPFFDAKEEYRDTKKKNYDKFHI